MNSKLDRRVDSLVSDIRRYLEGRDAKVGEGEIAFNNVTEGTVSTGYRVIGTILLEAVGIYLSSADDSYIETIERNVLDNKGEGEAIKATLGDFFLFLKYGEIPEITKDILRSFRERESKFKKGVYSYDSLGEAYRKGS